MQFLPISLLTLRDIALQGSKVDINLAMTQLLSSQLGIVICSEVNDMARHNIPQRPTRKISSLFNDPFLKKGSPDYTTLNSTFLPLCSTLGPSQTFNTLKNLLKERANLIFLKKYIVTFRSVFQNSFIQVEFIIQLIFVQLRRNLRSIYFLVSSSATAFTLRHPYKKKNPVLCM